MTRLSVNINKIALIRNSRGGNLPDLNKFAKDCEDYGAQGITVHPRPDERHIRYSDCYELRPLVKTEFNIEGYPSDKFIKMVCEVKPHQCTLVPDPPGALTSDSGWDTVKNKEFLSDVAAKLKEHGIRVSLFLDADPKLVEPAKLTGADRIELYTGDYAKQYYADRAKAVEAHALTAKAAREVGIGVNAGHDLNLDNLKYYKDHVTSLLEVSIGHALVCDALYYGVQNVIEMYLRQLNS